MPMFINVVMKTTTEIDTDTVWHDFDGLCCYASANDDLFWNVILYKDIESNNFSSNFASDFFFVDVSDSTRERKKVKNRNYDLTYNVQNKPKNLLKCMQIEWELIAYYRRCNVVHSPPHQYFFLEPFLSLSALFLS